MPSTPPTKHLRRHSSGCAMLDQLLSDICNTLVTSEEQVNHTHLLMLPTHTLFRERAVIPN